MWRYRKFCRGAFNFPHFKKEEPACEGFPDPRTCLQMSSGLQSKVIRRLKALPRKLLTHFVAKKNKPWSFFREKNLHGFTCGII